MTDLNQAIHAIKSGNRTTAINILRSILSQNSQHEQAWLYLAMAVDSKKKQIACLHNVLTINPHNKNAQQALLKLQPPSSLSTNSQSPKLPQEVIIHVKGKRLTREEAIEAVAFAQRYNRTVDLSHTNLSGIDLRQIEWSDAFLGGVNFQHADLYQANLRHCFIERANFQQANLVQADLTESNLKQCNLVQTNLQETCLNNANLTRADLTGAKLNQATLEWANLSQAILDEADLSGASLTNAIVEGASFKKIHYDSLTVWPDGMDLSTLPQAKPTTFKRVVSRQPSRTDINIAVNKPALKRKRTTTKIRAVAMHKPKPRPWLKYIMAVLSVVLVGIGFVVMGLVYIMMTNFGVEHSNLVYDQTVEDYTNEVDTWSFEGNKGDKVSIMMYSDSIDPYLTITDPSGIMIAHDSGTALKAHIADLVLTTPGRYTIFATKQDDSWFNWGRYNLQLTLNETLPPDHPDYPDGQIEYGQTIHSRVVIEDILPWRFEGQAGQAISIKMDSTSFSPKIALYSPAEELLAESYSSYNSHESILADYLLITSGTYIIMPQSGDYSQGAYELTLTLNEQHNLADWQNRNQQLRYGQPVEGQVMSDLPDVWEFRATMGDRITLQVESDTLNFNVSLIAPTGEPVTIDNQRRSNPKLFEDDYFLPNSGLYTLNIERTDTSYGDYHLHLILKESFDVRLIAYGEAFQHTLQSIDKGGLWMFQGQVGDIISVRLNSDAFDPFLQIFGANGKKLIDDNNSGGGRNAKIAHYKLPYNGAYIVFVRTVNRKFGPYELYLDQE